MNKKHLVSTILSFLILSLFLIPYFNVSAKTTSQYKGKIGNYPITIEVYKEEKDKIKGRYMYDKVGKWLKLEGKILKNNRVIIYDMMKITKIQEDL
jgi:peptidoglycan hydrolase CwlO-like protein